MLLSKCSHACDNPACQPALQGTEGCAATPAPHRYFLQQAARFHSPPSPSARRDSSAPRPPSPRGATALSVPPWGSCPQWVCAAGPGPCARTPARCAGRGCSAWGTVSLGERLSLAGDRGSQRTQAGPTEVGFILPAQHSSGPRSAPSRSICARIRSDGRDRQGRTARLCEGLGRRGAPAPYLLPGRRLRPFIRAASFHRLREQHRSCPVRGTCSAGHHTMGSVSAPTALRPSLGPWCCWSIPAWLGSKLHLSVGTPALCDGGKYGGAPLPGVKPALLEQPLQ